MENFAFSPSENTFYAMEFRGAYDAAGTWPGDAVSVSDSVYHEFSAARAGQIRVVTDGLPTWADIPPLTQVQLVAQADAQKDTLLTSAKNAISIWQTKLLMGRALSSDESVQLNIWMDYIDIVTAIDTSTAPDIDWPSVPSIESK